MFPQMKAWQAYRQVATQTASPAQVVLLLYNGAIRFLEQARLGFGFDDPKEFNETINNNILRAQAIINEMNQALNMAEGGEFAQKMRGLYDYLDRILQESNVGKTEPGIQEVIKHITVLRDAWAEMLQQGSGTADADALARAQSVVTPPPSSAHERVAGTFRFVPAMAASDRRRRRSHYRRVLEPGGKLSVRESPAAATHH